MHFAAKSYQSTIFFVSNNNEFIYIAGIKYPQMHSCTLTSHVSVSGRMSAVTANVIINKPAECEKIQATGIICL